jgi:hypothetical protein
MNLIWGNNDQNRGDTLVPKAAVQIDNYGGLNFFNLTKVDDRPMFLAKNTFYAKLPKSTPNDKRIWYFDSWII